MTDLASAAYDPRTLELLKLVHQALEPAKHYAIGGGFALRAYGYARYTSDVDVFVLDEHRSEVIQALKGVGLTVEPLKPPFHYIAYLPEHNDLDVRIDIMLPAEEPELSATEWPSRETIAGLKFNVIDNTLLMAMKFYSDRPKDHADLAEMLRRNLMDPDATATIIASVDPESAEMFKEEIRLLQTPRTPRRRPTKRFSRKP